MRRRFGAALIASLAGSASAGEFSLQLPVDCPLGEDRPCYIQSYLDHDPGPGFRDYACQGLSYDGHKGTDFALRSHAEIARGVAVTAAAAGRVTATRDGMADRVYTEEDADRIAGRDCGNGVVIAHPGGWETQYCHMRRGSVAVEIGTAVAPGDVLGMVGMSGRASFPHVHLSLRKGGAEIDPFAPSGAAACDADPAVPSTETLWSDPPAYQPGGLIAAGFAAAVPEYDAIKAGTAGATSLAPDAPALVLWGFAFGGREGDVLRLEILGPDGTPIFAQEMGIDKPQAQVFRAGGRRTAGAEWFAPGTYTGHVQLRRGDSTISDLTTTVTVGD